LLLDAVVHNVFNFGAYTASHVLRKSSLSGANKHRDFRNSISFFGPGWIALATHNSGHTSPEILFSL